MADSRDSRDSPCESRLDRSSELCSIDRDSVPSIMPPADAEMKALFAPVLAVLNRPDQSAMSMSERRDVIEKGLLFINHVLEKQGHDERVQRMYLPFKLECEQFLLSTSTESADSDSNTTISGTATCIHATHIHDTILKVNASRIHDTNLQVTDPLPSVPKQVQDYLLMLRQVKEAQEYQLTKLTAELAEVTAELEDNKREVDFMLKRWPELASVPTKGCKLHHCSIRVEFLKLMWAQQQQAPESQ